MLLAALISRKRRAVFCDSTLRDRVQSRSKGLLKRVYFSLCHGFFTYGQRGAEYLIHYGADPARIYRRVQAAALPEGYSRERAFRARITVERATDAPVFLYVGRLSPEKSLDVLLLAFVKVKAEFRNAKLRIVGAGGQRDDLLRLCKRLGLSSSVNFVGSLDLDALANEYLNATCLVLPSRSEPWGLVVNEALHFGCPAIVSDCCGCLPELVVEGVTGFSFIAGDAEDLSAKMIDAVSLFEDSEKSANDCLHAIDHFSPARSAEETLLGCASIYGCHPPKVARIG
jgi:glycosyltransferase involved in cell wall biosynthesis